MVDENHPRDYDYVLFGGDKKYDTHSEWTRTPTDMGEEDFKLMTVTFILAISKKRNSITTPQHFSNSMAQGIVNSFVAAGIPRNKIVGVGVSSKTATSNKVNVKID